MCRKAAGAGDDLDTVAVATHVEPLQRADRRIGLTFGGAKGREVVAADEPLRGRMHGVGVERALDVPGPAERHGEGRAPIVDHITIMPTDRREARLESFVHLTGAHDGDRRRLEMGVERVAQPVDAPLADEIDMGDLTQRMNAGVRAARRRE